MSKFQTKVEQKLEGKTKKDVASKIARLAQSAIVGQISALEASRVQKEIELENAKDEVEDALYPTSLDALKNGQNYVENILKARKNLAKVEKELTLIDDLVTTFKADAKEFVAEKVAPTSRVTKTPVK